MHLPSDLSRYCCFRSNTTDAITSCRHVAVQVHGYHVYKQVYLALVGDVMQREQKQGRSSCSGSHERWLAMFCMPFPEISLFFCKTALILEVREIYVLWQFVHSRCNHLSLMQSMCSCDVCMSFRNISIVKVIFDFLCNDQECKNR